MGKRKRRKPCVVKGCKTRSWTSKSGKSHSKFCAFHLEERKTIRKWINKRTRLPGKNTLTFGTGKVDHSGEVKKTY